LSSFFFLFLEKREGQEREILAILVNPKRFNQKKDHNAGLVRRSFVVLVGR
jgi:hypothetical protein